MAKLSIETEEDRQRETRREKRLRQRQASERKLLEELAEEHLTDDKLTDEQKEEFTAMFDEWEPGVFYEDGKRIEYNGSVYQVNPGHGHTSHDDWKPDATPALFRTVYQTTATDPETNHTTAGGSH